MQVRPASAGISSGATDRSHLSRAELWTKDVIDYLQNLLDEFRRSNYNSNSHLRERSPQMLYTGPTQQKGEAASSALDGDEPSLHFRWWYMVRLLQWHHTEGLVLPSPIIDWVLSQLQVCFFLFLSFSVTYGPIWLFKLNGFIFFAFSG